MSSARRWCAVIAEPRECAGYRKLLKVNQFRAAVFVPLPMSYFLSMVDGQRENI